MERRVSRLDAGFQLSEKWDDLSCGDGLMAGKQAKLIPDAALEDMLLDCEAHRYPHRDRVIVLLSAKAGLRAMEIAKLRRYHVMTADQHIDLEIHLENKICKKGSGRTIPINAELRSALTDLFHKVPGPPSDPLILSERSMRDPTADEPLCMEAKSIVYFFYRLYRRVGLTGCSSHSGRRTFGTKAARQIVKVGGSLRDVQQMLGHKDLATTQKYIEGDSEAKRRVVDLI